MLKKISEENCIHLWDSLAPLKEASFAAKDPKPEKTGYFGG